jgi:hypothetical protein
MARQYGSTTRRVLILSLLLSLVLTGSVWAESPRLAGDGTIREWRADIVLYGAGGEALALAYAAGAMAWQNIVVWCPYPITVGELAAYLLYGAEPGWTLRQALFHNAGRRGCSWTPSDEVLRDLGIAPPVPAAPPSRTPEPPPQPRPAKPTVPWLPA